MTQADPLATVVEYHEQTKHHLQRSARSLGYLDWANQPDPFRRFDGAPQTPLEHPPVTLPPTYDGLFRPAAITPARLDRQSLSRLFYDSLALSAWKQVPGSKAWSLRVNPSSGALHPTEGYLIAGAIPDLSSEPAVYHYAPYQHALEQRRALPSHLWGPLAEQLPAESVLVALTSIYWRESWKYGERAFRYCHHDVGHALGALAFAAAARGWQARLIPAVADEPLAALLGLDRQSGVEAEHPDALLAIGPSAAGRATPGVAFRWPEPLRTWLARSSVGRHAQSVEPGASSLADHRGRGAGLPAGGRPRGL